MTAEQGYEYAIDNSAIRPDCDIWYAVPPGFVDVPFGALLAERDSAEAAELIAAVEALLGMVPPEKQGAFLAELDEAQQLTARMRKEGLVHCSLGIHEADDGTLLQSVLSIARRETLWTPPKLGAVRAATARESALIVSVADLPCGPGAFTEAQVDVPVDVDPQQRALYEATAYLPYPNGRRLAVLTLTTTAVGAREYYRDILRAVAGTVSFNNPLPKEIRDRVPEPEAAASARAAFG